MSVFRLLKTRAGAAAAADAATGAEGPGHARLTSGTVCVSERVRLFSVLFVHLFAVVGC